LFEICYNYFKKGGAICLDLESSEDEDDLFDEWRNHLLRESIAKSSLVKVRQTSNSTFFTKGKVKKIFQFFVIRKSRLAN